MTPERALAKLNRQLAKHGQLVTITRKGYPPVTVPALVRRADPEALTGGIVQTKVKVTVSPTGFEAWSPPPGEGDWVKTEDGDGRKSLPAEIVRLDGVVVRINLTVEGA